MSPSRRTRVAAIVLLTAGWVQVASAFDVHRHAFMVQSSLTGSLEGNAMTAAIAGVIYPDISGCALDGYCDGWKRVVTQACRGSAGIVSGLLNSVGRPDQGAIRALGPDHFDDDSIERSRTRAESRIGRARGILQRIAPALDSADERQDFVGAMLIFGTVLHATQDFYAHSNYAECHTRDPNVDVRTIPLWDGRREVASCEAPTRDSHEPPRNLTGLVSGVYYGANSDEEDGDFAAGANKTHHDDINKDNPDDAAPQGSRPLRSSGDPKDLYAAVSGQIGDRRDVSHPYTQLGLAARHTRAAYESLVDGRPLFGNRPLRVSDGEIDPIRLTARAAENPVRQLLRNAASDTEVLTSLTAALSESGFAGCLLGPDTAQALFRWVR